MKDGISGAPKQAITGSAVPVSVVSNAGAVRITSSGDTRVTSTGDRRVIG